MSTEKRAPLDRARVADTALKLLNELGLDGLTLRAIARELDVKAPALYWHFKDKQALLDEMATEMYRRMIAGTALDPGDTWQERLLKSNRGLRAALLGYRDGAKVFSGSRFTSLVHVEAMEDNLRLFTSAGFTLAQAVRAASTTYVYTLGFVTEEQGVEPLPGDRREGYDIEERARRMADFPLSAAAGKEIFEDYDKHFEEGLALIITGIDNALRGAGNCATSPHTPAANREPSNPSVLPAQQPAATDQRRDDAQTPPAAAAPPAPAPHNAAT